MSLKRFLEPNITFLNNEVDWTWLRTLEQCALDSLIQLSIEKRTLEVLPPDLPPTLELEKKLLSGVYSLLQYIFSMDIGCVTICYCSHIDNLGPLSTFEECADLIHFWLAVLGKEEYRGIHKKFSEHKFFIVEVYDYYLDKMMCKKKSSWVHTPKILHSNGHIIEAVCR